MVVVTVPGLYEHCGVGEALRVHLQVGIQGMFTIYFNRLCSQELHPAPAHLAAHVVEVHALADVPPRVLDGRVPGQVGGGGAGAGAGAG